jgi:transcriptional regulator with XRE-family HTH domain
MTIFELAEQTGIPVYRLVAIEAGRVRPRVVDAEALSKAADIPARFAECTKSEPLAPEHTILIVRPAAEVRCAGCA